MTTSIPAMLIVPRTPRLSLAAANSAALAIQKQILSDFEPCWHKNGLISASANPQVGAIPIFVVDHIENGFTGLHYTENGYPYALVLFGPLWSLAASHECLEILADPTANLFIPSTSWDGKIDVKFLAEVCDPCQDAHYSYIIDSWVVSDFCTLEYYTDLKPVPSRIYSFKNHISGPKQVLPGGTLAWVTVDGHAHQAANDNGNLITKDLGIFSPGPMPARAYLNEFDQSFSRQQMRDELPLHLRHSVNGARRTLREQSKLMANHYNSELIKKIEI